MCHMHFVCAALHVMGLGCGFNIVFYDAIVSWPFAGRWATHMESRGAHCYIFGVDKDKAFEFFFRVPLRVSENYKVAKQGGRGPFWAPCWLQRRKRPL